MLQVTELMGFETVSAPISLYETDVSTGKVYTLTSNGYNNADFSIDALPIRIYIEQAFMGIRADKAFLMNWILT